MLIALDICARNRKVRFIVRHNPFSSENFSPQVVQTPFWWRICLFLCQMLISLTMLSNTYVIVLLCIETSPNHRETERQATWSEVNTQDALLTSAIYLSRICIYIYVPSDDHLRHVPQATVSFLRSHGRKFPDESQLQLVFVG